MSFSLHILNVSHGDSIVFSSDDGKIGLIDCCKLDGSIPALDFIRDRQTRKIEFVCLTHPHKDHLDGLLEVFEYCLVNSIDISYFYQLNFSLRDVKRGLGLTKSSDEFARLINWVCNPPPKSGIVFRYCNEGQTIFDSGGVTVTVIAPKANIYSKRTEQLLRNPERGIDDLLNELSLVLLVQDENCGSLLLSDSSISILKDVTSLSHLRGTIDFFKVSHHGSSRNFYQPLYKKHMKAQCACGISGGCRVDIPIGETVSMLKGLGMEVYATNYAGFPATMTATILEESDYTGIPQLVLDAIEDHSLPVPVLSPMIPYHGSITCDFDPDGISISTETGKPSL